MASRVQILAAAAVATVLAGAGVATVVGDDGDHPQREVRPHDFVARLEHAELGAGWSPTRYGGRAGNVGPAEFRLADGRVLDVPPGTPGGNLCPLLMRRQDVVALTGLTNQDRYEDITRAPKECVLIGGLSADGRSITWFEVFTDLDDTGYANAGTLRGGGRDDSGRVVTNHGFAFPPARHVTVDCGTRSLDFESVIDDDDYLFQASVDPSTGELVRLDCIGRE